MHKKRWITGLAALPFLVGLISWGGPALFTLVIAGLALLGVYETYRLVDSGAGVQEPAGPSVSAPMDLPLRVLAYGFGALVVYGAFHGASLLLFCFAANLMLVGFREMLEFDGNTKNLGPVFKQVFVVSYVPVLLAHLVLIRNGDSGVTWIYLMLVAVFAGDIGAFYAGTYRGRRKLCPAVSPKKTLEGALGGLASTLTAGSLFRILFLPELPFGVFTLFLTMVGIAAQLGDLFESLLKRAAGVKDSGVIFPGHGGLLDRVDALLFAAPVGFFFKEWLL